MKDKYLREYYENYDEDGRLLTRHGHIEFITTMHYIEKYLRPGDVVLEIGAGTGRYSHALAGRGFAVDAVELIEHNIEIFKSKIAEDENISVRQGNAIDLSFIEDDTYDVTLLLGPMYHLYNEEEKLRALSRGGTRDKTRRNCLRCLLYGRCICSSVRFWQRRYQRID